MTAEPPKATIVFQGSANDVSNDPILMGIDTQFFNINSTVSGIKLIPTGTHFIHYSTPAFGNNSEDVTENLRHGYWFECKEGDVFCLSWNQTKGGFDLTHILSTQRQREDALENVAHTYPFMIVYPANDITWKQRVTNYVDMDIIKEFVPYREEDVSSEINTLTPSVEENLALTDILQKDLSSRDPLRGQQEELRFTVINFKERRDHTKSGKEITASFLDRTWYLEKLFGHNDRILFAELQISFVLFILLGSFASAIQWLHLLKLILTCQDFLLTDLRHTLNLLEVLHDQLKILPEDYLNPIFTGDNLIDVKDYVSMMENFCDIIPGGLRKVEQERLRHLDLEQKWKQILEINYSRFGFNFYQSEKQTDNEGTEIYGLNNHDENDEDAPAIAN